MRIGGAHATVLVPARQPATAPRTASLGAGHKSPKGPARARNAKTCGLAGGERVRDDGRETTGCAEITPAIQFRERGMKTIGMAVAFGITMLTTANAQTSPLNLADSVRACQQIENDAARLACFDRMTDQSESGSGNGTAVGAWAFAAQTDPIDDSKSALAQVIDIRPMGQAVFSIRCINGRLNNLITFNREYFSDEVRRVTYRLDDEVPDRWTMYIAVSKTAYGIWDHASAERFTKQLSGHRQLAMRIEKSSGERLDAVFAIEGVDEAVKKIQADCGGSN